MSLKTYFLPTPDLQEREQHIPELDAQVVTRREPNPGPQSVSALENEGAGFSMNTIHWRPSSFDPISRVPGTRGVDDGGKLQSDEESLFAVQLLTIPQVAAKAQTSTKSIYRWVVPENKQS